MAKYYYDKYTVGKDWSAEKVTYNRMSTGSVGWKTKPIQISSATFYPSFTFIGGNGDGYVGEGTPIVRTRGQNPPVGYYYISASMYVTRVHKILEETELHSYFGEMLPHHYTDVYSRNWEYKADSLVDRIVAEDGTYPDNGRQGDYWYIKRELVFPELKVNINQQIKTSENGWVRVNGQLREIDTIWVRINGAIKEVQ